jgi:xanthine dehydrogenase large subunit
MGGGFGGKESQSALWAAAPRWRRRKLRRPVKLRADRDDDMLVTGKRHCFDYAYEAGFDDHGRIVAARVEMVTRAGFSADLSGPVATRAVCHFDNAYYLSDVDIAALCGKTNTQSNTAFRGFGGPQGAIAIENIIDEIARSAGPRPARRAHAPTSTARRHGRPQRHAVRPESHRQRDPRAGRAPRVDSSAYRARRAADCELTTAPVPC